MQSSNGAIQTRTFGVASDIPAQGDYDGDGKGDIAVWRPAGGQFWIQVTSNGAIANSTLGTTGDGVVANFNVH
jgi:hypothetical protein